MSKLAFTILVPHDKTDGKRTPGFVISTSNITVLSVKGKDLKGARIGNSNAKSGWKNRIEYGVTTSKAATKISLIMNTSVVLPPIQWVLPILGETKAKEIVKQVVKGKEKEKPKEDGPSRLPRPRRDSPGASSHSGSRTHTSRSSQSSRETRESGRSSRSRREREREDTYERPPPRIKEPREQRPPVWVDDRDHRDHRDHRGHRDYQDHRQRHERERRRRRTVDPGFIDHYDVDV